MHVAGYILQWTWGLPQNLLGLVLFLVCFRGECRRYRGAVVTVWNRPYSASLGMFLFMSGPVFEKGTPRREREPFRRLRVHEYGHTVQSALLGPLYLPLVWLPSCLWAVTPGLKAYRRRNRVSYYAFYTERWANRLGEWATGERSMGQAYVDF